jgi:hypothetical protein
VFQAYCSFIAVWRKGGGFPNILYSVCYRFLVILFTYRRRSFIADRANRQETAVVYGAFGSVFHTENAQLRYCVPQT